MAKKKWAQWLYWFTLGVSIVLVYKTLDSFTAILDWINGVIDILMPFIGAILLSYILYIPVRKMENLVRKIPIKFISKRARGFSVLSVYMIAIAIIVIAIKFVLPAISSSIIDLVKNIPGYYENAISFVNTLPANTIIDKENLEQVLQGLQNIDFNQFINVENVTGAAAKGVMGFTNVVFDLFVTVVVSIYLLLERMQILKFIRKLAGAMLDRKTYKRLGNYFRKTNEIFYNFLSSQVIDAVVVGILMSVALSIMNVKYAILLGFMIGLFNIIPYFGAIIGVVIAVIITMFTGGFTQALIMTAVVIILQQIDANIINPKIVGTSLELSPILIIFAVTVGGAYFGILGMFLAVPVIAILKILLLDYIEFRNLTKKRNNIKKI